VVEEALRDGVPNFTALVAEDPVPPRATTIQLGPTVLHRPRWVDVGTLDELSDGEMRALWPEGQGILVVRLGGEAYAHQNTCPPGSALALHLGTLDGSTLVCPWHGCRYDIRTGKRLDAEGKLGVLPVAVKDGMVKVAMGLEEVTVP
jgi:nitrite reductase/ring-hydroxylating ferredoxin subunit